MTLILGYTFSDNTIIQQNTDLVLLAIDSQEINSFLNFKQIKDTKELQDVPIIITGIFRDQRIKEKYLKAGCADYIETPFHIEEVISRVRTHIKLHCAMMQLTTQLANKTADLSLKTTELEETVIALKVLHHPQAHYSQG